MKTLTYNQGYNEPQYTELIEDYDGEAREIILQDFIDNGFLRKVVYTEDYDSEDIELITEDYFTPVERQALTEIEQLPECFWSHIDLETLVEHVESAHARTKEREAHI